MSENEQDVLAQGETIHAVAKPILLFFRTRRMRHFVKTFDVTDQTKIIDVGGNRLNWDLIDPKPHVTMVNILGEEWAHGRFRMINYDGATLPFADQAFDI